MEGQIKLADIPRCANLHNHHSRTDPVNKGFDGISRKIVASSELKDAKSGKISRGEFSTIYFPYAEMGTITSLELSGLDELIIVALYWNR